MGTGMGAGMDTVTVIFGLLAGLVLMASMIPHQVRHIRLISLVAGLLGVIYFALAEGLGAGLAFTAAYVLVNIGRLAELRRRARGGMMTSEERELFDHVMQIEEPAQQSRLRDLMIWEDVSVGFQLIKQGEIDPPLIYIASGRAEIERDLAIVSECGASEFLGEMSLVSGDRASATVTVTQDMRMARLDRDALGQLARSLPEVGKALDRAFNRSLAVKVLRMNESSR